MSPSGVARQSSGRGVDAAAGKGQRRDAHPSIIEKRSVKQPSRRAVVTVVAGCGVRVDQEGLGEQAAQGVQGFRLKSVNGRERSASREVPWRGVVRRRPERHGCRRDGDRHGLGRHGTRRGRLRGHRQCLGAFASRGFLRTGAPGGGLLRWAATVGELRARSGLRCVGAVSGDQTAAEQGRNAQGGDEQNGNGSSNHGQADLPLY